MSGLPSWVPDWTLPRSKNGLQNRQHGSAREDREYIYNACYNEMARNPEEGWIPEPCKHVMPADLDNVLPLEGLRCALVDSVYSSPSPSANLSDWWERTLEWRHRFTNAFIQADKFMREDETMLSQMEGTRSERRPELRKVRRGLSNMIFGDKSKKSEETKSRVKVMDAHELYWETVMQGTMPRSFACSPSGPSVGNRDADDYYSSTQAAFNNSSSINNSTKRTDGQVVRLTSAVRRECYRVGVALDLGAKYEGNLDLDELFKHVHKQTAGQKLWFGHSLQRDNLGLDMPVKFMTGLGPAQLQELDEVWVLAGGTHAVALGA